MSRRELEDDALLEHIRRVFDANAGTYGSPRVHRQLRAEGIRVGRKRVARLMRQAGLKARAARIYKRSPGTKRFFNRTPNLAMEKTTTAPNQVLVGDITYLKVDGKLRYLAGVLDRHSRRLLGWAMSSKKDVELTATALERALEVRPPQPGTIFHSDRGSEYCAYAYGERLAQAGILQSTNRPLRINDNAVMESFWHTLKSELYHHATFDSEKHLEKELEAFFDNYNSRRLHSSLDYKPPIQYELELRRAA